MGLFLLAGDLFGLAMRRRIARGSPLQPGSSICVMRETLQLTKRGGPKAAPPAV